ncbi:hypothetical protein L6164_022632 [Bauhinia variegata]|uniref:Uncharacterized protein n=1 Tax=Bauhinia variegata TaxID=167791 RepID=A0ACB9MG75_BAUVA|nr:hypothetical protein L6164_022632 [Bauhinia variegata]
MRDISRAVCFTFILFLVLVFKVEGRFLRSNISDEMLVSDGVDDGVQPNQDNSYLLLKGIEPSEKQCEEMFGFVLCSSSIYGLLTLIFFYEFMLFQGESYLAAGSKQIFEILGPGVFGSSAFDILGALPESIVFVASGLSGNKEVAQEYAQTGVGLLAGSSIFLLTLVWGVCVFRGSQELTNDSMSKRVNGSKWSFANLKAFLTDFGITRNVATRNIAKFMILSVTPPLIMQIPNVFQFSSVQRTTTLMIALMVAILLLVSYVIYQIFEPHIHKIIRLKYVEHDYLISRILQQAPKHTLQSILTENGTPDENSMKIIFEFLDKNRDGEISRSELKELLLTTRSTETNTNEENEVEQLFRNFDRNGDGKLSYEEFVNGFKTWFDQTKQAMVRQFLTRKALKRIHEVFMPSLQNIRNKHNLKKIESDILSQVTAEDRTAIERFFGKLDINGDGCISQSELKELVKNISPGLDSSDVEELTKKIITLLDSDNNGKISLEEFVNGIEKWHNESSNSVSHGQNLRAFNGIENLVRERHGKGVVLRVKGIIKALMNVALGFAMLYFFAEPLISSVQKLSEHAGIPSLIISFVLVPLAINGREAAFAVNEASHKNSETIYEIYDAVSMNNILGFLAISVLIFLRGVTWEFSAELLVVALVCPVMGVAAIFCSKFPLWTSILGCLLYPLSLSLIFVVNDVLNYV